MVRIAQYVLGVQLGAGRFALCVLSDEGHTEYRRTQVATASASAYDTLLDLSAAIGSVLRTRADAGTPIAAIGVALPGLVETTTGVLRFVPRLGWRDVDLPAVLRKHLDLGGLPVVTGNDANLSALAEQRAGSPGLPKDFLYLAGDLGIGCGIVLGGFLLDGASGYAGEIGHLQVTRDGPDCPCGSRGCLDLVADLAATMDAAGIDPALPHADRQHTLVRRLNETEPRAIAAIESTAGRLGRALANVITLLDIPTVVLGGDYARLSPWLATPILAALRAAVLGAPWSDLRVVRSRLGTEAAMRGAAELALHALRG